MEKDRARLLLWSLPLHEVARLSGYLGGPDNAKFIDKLIKRITTTDVSSCNTISELYSKLYKECDSPSISSLNINDFYTGNGVIEVQIRLKFSNLTYMCRVEALDKEHRPDCFIHNDNNEIAFRTYNGVERKRYYDVNSLLKAVIKACKSRGIGEVTSWHIYNSRVNIIKGNDSQQWREDAVKPILQKYKVNGTLDVSKSKLEYMCEDGRPLGLKITPFGIIIIHGSDPLQYYVNGSYENVGLLWNGKTIQFTIPLVKALETHKIKEVLDHVLAARMEELRDFKTKQTIACCGNRVICLEADKTGHMYLVAIDYQQQYTMQRLMISDLGAEQDFKKLLNLITSEG